MNYIEKLVKLINKKIIFKNLKEELKTINDKNYDQDYQLIII